MTDLQIDSLADEGQAYLTEGADLNPVEWAEGVCSALSGSGRAPLVVNELRDWLMDSSPYLSSDLIRKSVTALRNK